MGINNVERAKAYREKQREQKSDSTLSSSSNVARAESYRQEHNIVRNELKSLKDQQIESNRKSQGIVDSASTVGKLLMPAGLGNIIDRVGTKAVDNSALRNNITTQDEQDYLAKIDDFNARRTQNVISKYNLGEDYAKNLGANGVNAERIVSKDLKAKGVPDSHADLVADYYAGQLREEGLQTAQQFADVAPVWASAVSVIGNIAGGVYNNFDALNDAFSGNRINNNTMGAYIQNVGSTIQNTVAENINNNISDTVDNFFQKHNIGNSKLQETVKKVALDAGENLYSGAMAVADILANRALGIGVIGQGLEKASQVKNDAVDRGLNNKQIIANQIMSGVTTAATEAMALGKIDKLAEMDIEGLTLWDIIKQSSVKMVAGGIAEGFQEDAEEVADTIVDVAIARDKSNLISEYKEYINNGDSSMEAIGKVLENFLITLWKDFAGGFIAGEAIGGVSTVNYQLKENSINKSTGKALNEERASQALQGTEGEQRYLELVDLYSNKEKDNNYYRALGQITRKTYSQADTSLRDNLTKAFEDNGYDAKTASRMANEIANTRNYSDVSDSTKEAFLKVTDSEEFDNANKANDTKTALNKSFKTFSEDINAKARTKNLKKLNVTTKAVPVEDIQDARVEGDKIVFEKASENGVETVNAKDVVLSSNQANLIAMASDIQDSTIRKAVIENYKGGDADAYITASELAYNYGEQGISYESAVNSLSNTLSEIQIVKLYDAGNKASQNESIKLAESTDKLIKSWNKEVVHGSFEMVGFDEKSLSSTKKMEANFIRALNLGGINTRLINDPSSESINGEYDSKTNTITINLASRFGKTVNILTDKGYVISTTAHELTHWMRGNNEAGYKALKNAVITAMGKDKFDQFALDHLNSWAENHKNEDPMTQDEAEEEVVARACEDMLNNPDNMEKILSTMSSEEMSSFKEDIKKIFQAIRDFLTKLMKNFRSASPEAMAIQSSIEAYNNVEKLWLEGIQNAMKANQARLEIANQQNKTPQETADNLADAIENNDTATVKAEMGKWNTYNAREKNSLKLDSDLYQKALEKNSELRNVSNQVMQNAGVIRARVANELKKLEKFLPEDIEGNIISDNASYNASVEHALICVRSLVNNWFLDEVSTKLGRPLTVEESVACSMILAEKVGNQRECIYCYVAQDRRAYREMFIRYVDEYNNLYDNVQKNRKAYKDEQKLMLDKEKLWATIKKDTKSDGSFKKKYDGTLKLFATYLDGRKATENQVERYMHFVQDGLDKNKRIDMADFATDKNAKRLEADEVKGWLATDARKYAQSASWQKLSSRNVKINGEEVPLEYIAYDGGILKMSDDMVDMLNHDFGLRIYSYSDYVPAFLLEDMQIVTDASVRGLKMLAYTKDIAFARIFGSTGMGINVSCHASLNEAYKNDKELDALRKAYKDDYKNKSKRDAYLEALAKYIDSDAMQGAEWDDVKALRNKFSNVGAVMVCENDDLVEWALAQDWVDVVIPYHTVRTGKVVAEMFGWKDYKSSQEDSKIKGEWNEDNDLKSIPPTVHGNDRQKYEDALKANHLTHRFAEWADNENYMKLVNETRMAYTDLNPVQPVFMELDADEYDDEVAFETTFKDTFKPEFDRIWQEGKYGFAQGVNTIEEQEQLFSDTLQTAVERISSGRKLSEKAGYAPVFYSHMAREIDKIKLDKIGASSIIPFLKGRGIKDDEIKWSGIATFLEGKKSVTKAELQEFARNSMLNIEEETLSSNKEEMFDKFFSAINEYYEFDLGDFDKYQDFEGDFLYDYFKEDVDELLEEGEINETDHYNILDLAKQFYDGTFAKNVTNWSEYKLDGGTNYRELLFKMPGSTYSNNAMKMHWGQSGVLAHARIQDMESATHGKMLFVEEIQSDWHNALQKTDSISRLQSQSEKAGARYDELIANHEKLFGVSYEKAVDAYLSRDYVKQLEFLEGITSKGKTREEWIEYSNEIENTKSKQLKALRDLSSIDANVPDAPFQNYTDYVMKRLLRMAAEGGYDSIGWTTGKIQENRWSSQFAEGYRIEYDQEIPKFLNKYGKQWGAKVEDGFLGTEEEYKSYKDDRESFPNSTVSSVFNDSVVHAMALTDSMKNDVLYKGQTMYSQKYDVTNITDEQYKELKKHFGTTNNFNVAGYLLKDGYMLDFSGKHWGGGDSGSREVDHRDISEVLPTNSDGIDSMVNMISNGNIRLMPETGGINLSVMPTSQQFTILKRYIDYMRTHGDGIVAVDFDEVGGDTVKSLFYEKPFSTDQVIKDIKNYFNGTMQSDLMRFHTMYSNKIDSMSEKELSSLIVSNGQAQTIEEAQYGAKGIRNIFNSIESTIRNKGAMSRGRDSSSRFITLGIASNFIRTGKIDFSRLRLSKDEVKASYQIASYAMVYRDPSIETFRILYTSNNKVVFEEAFTSLLTSTSVTGMSKNSADNIASVKDKINKLHADGVFVLHNHPSGDPTPSPGDINVTKDYFDNIPEFKGHIVIDHSKYSFINRNGESALIDITTPTLSENYNRRIIDSEFLYKDMSITEEAQQVILGLAHKKDYISIVYASSNNIVRAIEEVPKSDMDAPDFEKKTVLFKIAFGSPCVYVVGSSELINSDKMVDLFRRDVFREVIDQDSFVLHRDLYQKDEAYLENGLLEDTPYERYSEKNDYVDITPGKLGFTDERIDELLSGSRYGSTNKNYAQAYITYMSPKQFLKLTTGKNMRLLDRISDFNTGEFSDGESFDVNKAFDKFNEWTRIFKLEIDEETGTVLNHNGRHRIYQLSQLGYNQIPVLLFDMETKYSKERKDTMLLYPQSINEDIDKFSADEFVTLKDVIPFSQGNRELIKEKFGSGSNATLFSEKVDTDNYKLLGENKRLKEQNDRLSQDVADLRKLVSLSYQNTAGRIWNPKDLTSVANFLLKEGKSNYDVKELKDSLAEAYNLITQRFSNNMGDSDADMNYIMDLCENIAVNIVNNSDYKPVSDTRILNEIKKSNVKLTDDASDIIKEASNIIKAVDKEEAIRDMAVQVYNKYWSMTKLKTATDKADARISELNANHRKAMETALNNQRLADRIHYGKIINEIRNQRDTKISELKEYQRTKEENRRTEAERRVEINRITDVTMTLASWMSQPDIKHPIPEAIKKPLATFLSAINATSKRYNGMVNFTKNPELNGAPTKKDLSLMSAMRGLKTMALEHEANQTDEALDSNNGDHFSNLDLPPEFAMELNNIYDQMSEIAEKYGDNEYVLQRLPLDTLVELRQMITALKKSVMQTNKLIARANAHSMDVYGHGTITNSDRLGQKKNGILDVGKLWSEFMEYGEGTPYYVFKRLGTDAKYMFEGLMLGQDRYAELIEEIEAFTQKLYKSEEANKWSNEVHEFTVLQEDADGNNTNVKVKMTTAQLMSLYCLSQREQAEKHIYQGGLVVSDFKEGNKTVSQPKSFTVTKTIMDMFMKELSKDARAVDVAREMQKYMSTTCSDWGNEITMKRWGIKGFIEDHYFPIRANSANLPTATQDKQSSIYALLNMSFTKKLNQYASNEIFVEDIFDVFATHTSQMAKYNSLALPVLDMIRWWNYKERVKKSDGTFTDKSVKTALNYAFGSESNKYIRRLLDDINGFKDKGRMDSVGSKLTKAYKVAAVGANLQVALLQPISYLRAINTIDKKYLTKALLMSPSEIKKSIARCQENCGMAKWKSLGFFETDVARNVADQIKHEETKVSKIVELSMKGAEFGDTVTWGFLWKACELKASEKYKSGTKEHLEATKDLMRETIYATQVVDSVLTRSQFMRGSDMYTKMTTAFLSEPTLSINVLMDAFTGLTQDMKSSSFSDAFKKNGRKIALGCESYIICAVVEAAVRTTIGRLRDDDDDETTLKQLINEIISQLNPLASLPIFKDLISLMQGYSSTRMDEEAFQQLIYAYKAVMKAVENNEVTYNTVFKTAKAVSQLVGLPISNLVRAFKTIYNNTIGRMYPSAKIE